MGDSDFAQIARLGSKSPGMRYEVEAGGMNDTCVRKSVSMPSVQVRREKGYEMNKCLSLVHLTTIEIADER